MLKNLVIHRKSIKFAPQIVLWCNGSTTGFGSVCSGSNPLRTTKWRPQALIFNGLRALFLFYPIKRHIAQASRMTDMVEPPHALPGAGVTLLRTPDSRGGGSAHPSIGASPGPSEGRGADPCQRQIRYCASPSLSGRPGWVLYGRIHGSVPTAVRCPQHLLSSLRRGIGDTPRLTA